MMKINKKFLIIFLLVFFIFAHRASANLEITEIMYNLDGSDIDWAEVYNPDPSSINLTELKLMIDDSSNHTINSYSDSGMLMSNEYGVIVPSSGISAFVSKWGNIKNLFTASFSLLNVPDGSSSQVEINNGDKNSPIDSVSYNISLGANGNGNSLQLINGEWKESVPTPGQDNILNEGNIISDTSDDTDSINDSSLGSASSTSSSSTPTKEDTKIYKITTKIIAPKVVIAGVPFIIDHQTFGIHKEKVIFGNFVWNFGDGMSKAVKTSDPFSYTYQYGGDYVLTLSFYASTFNTEPDAIDRINVKVVPSGVVISSVGTPSDPFIEIENDSSYEMSLRGWIVKGSVHTFVIPENTVILSSKKLKLSPKITGFDFGDLSSISIIDTSGQVFATYPNKNLPQVKYVPSTTVANSVKSDTAKISKVENLPEVINLNDLGASAGDSNVANNINKGLYFWLGLALIIFIGLVGVIFLRRKNDYPDYVEGELTAKDMTIIE